MPVVTRLWLFLLHVEADEPILFEEGTIPLGSDEACPVYGRLGQVELVAQPAEDLRLSRRFLFFPCKTYWTRRVGRLAIHARWR
jgi:hypothetical protein